MLTKTQIRFVLPALLGCGIGLPLQAQNGEAGQLPHLPDANNVQSQRLNRMPEQRTRPESYGIPATAPTANPLPAAPATTVQPEVASASSTGSVSVPETPSRRATVSYTGGKLLIVATNSSLNQILRDISHTAGITITGGVAEERVFGNYGPGTPAEVLNSLLDGTGSNMLYVQGLGPRKSELVLTTRTGGPTPPNPNAARFDAGDDQATPPPPPPPVAQEPPAVNSQPTAAQVPPPPDNAAPQPATPSSSGDSSGEQSTGGAKTPQQIFDELMKLRQQNQQRQ